MFPFTVYDEPYEFTKAFLAVRPADLNWHSFEVTVLSPTKVQFTVFDTNDGWAGRRPAQITKLEADVDASITRDLIERRALDLARRRRQDELRAAEADIIARYTAEILAQVV